MGLPIQSETFAFELLNTYEKRPVTLERGEIISRRRGVDLGRELNRLQGLESTAMDDRLIALWNNGQVTSDEYTDLCRRIAAEERKARTSGLEPDDR